MSYRAYFVANVDFKQDPPALTFAGIFGEKHPTISGMPFVLMEMQGGSFEKAKDAIADSIRLTAKRMPKHRYAQWCLEQLEKDR